MKLFTMKTARITADAWALSYAIVGPLLWLALVAPAAWVPDAWEPWYQTYIWVDADKAPRVLVL